MTMLEAMLQYVGRLQEVVTSMKIMKENNSGFWHLLVLSPQAPKLHLRSDFWMKLSLPGLPMMRWTVQFSPLAKRFHRNWFKI